MTRERSFVYWLGIIVLSISFSGCGKSAAQDHEQVIEAALTKSMQNWFSRFHPVGTAKRVALHEARVVDTPSGPQTVARFTLYWSGPLTTDGFTKIEAVHDKESRRWVRAQVLETNGVTNEQATEGVGEVIDALISE